uniref:Secreted protein n=1 Tax=Scophthalmus maximus TaxID=52904 RepID=A0A8D3C2Y3_SCOMX
MFGLMDMLLLFLFKWLPVSVCVRPSNEKNQHGMSINGSEKMCLHSDCWRDVPPRNSKERPCPH